MFSECHTQYTGNRLGKSEADQKQFSQGQGLGKRGWQRQELSRARWLVPAEVLISSPTVPAHIHRCDTEQSLLVCIKVWGVNSLIGRALLLRD